MFKPVHVSLYQACEIVRGRLGIEKHAAVPPIHDAIREGALSVFAGGEGERKALTVKVYGEAKVWWPSPYMATSPRAGELSSTDDLWIASADLDSLWPDRSRGSEQTQPQAAVAEAARPRAGGAPRKYDWEGALLELVRLQANEGTTNKRPGELADHLAAWFISTIGEAPADSEIKKRVRSFRAAAGEN